MEIVLQPGENLTIRVYQGNRERTYRVYQDESGVGFHETTLDLTDQEKHLIKIDMVLPAIKHYRERTGADLRESKDLCRGYQDGLSER
jgi:hypothetical protein